VRFTNQRFKQHSEASCLAYLESFKDTSNRFFAIEDINSGELMGTLTMFIHLQHQTADVGILIGESGLWGKGYGQEAFALAVDALFGSGKIRKVTAGTMSCNVMMIKIMQKCGMTLEATQKDQELVDGEPFDILYFAKFVNTDVPSTANASPAS
jgi:RimJ/RimL family protein N-acetyltransferase